MSGYLQRSLAHQLHNTFCMGNIIIIALLFVIIVCKNVLVAFKK